MKITKDNQKSQELLNELSSTSPQLEKIANLLNDGADINYQSAEDGYTPLMHATELGHNAISEYLLQVGAHPILQNHRHQIASALIQPQTPLYQYLKSTELLFATHAQDSALVKQLISQGADVNIQGAGSYTAFNRSRRK